MSGVPQLFCAVVVISALLCSFQAEASDGWPQSPACPSKIPSEWLAPTAHPRLFCTSAELASARETVKETDRGRAYLTEKRELCAAFLKMNESELRALVPKPGSLFVYGAGMNLDPVLGKRMIWCGLGNPFCVKDAEGKVYPNDEWKDDGAGSVDQKSGDRYYFVAQANAAIMQHLEQRVLPALADLYALDGNQTAARNAAILLDAISAVYASNKRGPIDYPLDYPGDEIRAGRLDRPYYQTARGLINYANTVDLIAPSGEFQRPSPLGQTIRENVIRDLLWNGGSFCWEYSVHDFQLYNGHADYLRGAAVVGILLGERHFSEPLLTGRSGVHAMLNNNIGRDGMYYENSPMYAEHTRELYITIADIVDAARNLGWKECSPIYSDPAMRLFLRDTFNRQEVGGHVPVLGDDGPDLFTNDPMRRFPTKEFALADNYINGQIQAAWVQLVKSPSPEDRKAAARLLADTFEGQKRIVPPSNQWAIYHIGKSAVSAVEAETPRKDDFETPSSFMGSKGQAMLRGGKGSKRYGAQLFFGPLHNHGQLEELSWSFYARGAEWSFDPGYYTSHFRFGWTQHTVAHQCTVVDGTSINPDCGSGHLVSWLSVPEVQWAMADHPSVYAEQGVTSYKRLIGQVENPATGELGYWIDVSFVDGGKMRDDSFHTQMKSIKLNAELSKPGEGSIIGSPDYGRIVQNDCRLKGYDDKGFYWEPDGSGYGFLGSPRKAVMPENLRVVMTDPAYAKKIQASIVADLLGGAGQELIVADAPVNYNSAPVPYVLRRDTGSGKSVFAKIVRLVDDSSSDHIRSFREVSVKEGKAHAWCVTWENGRRDLWVVGDASSTIVSMAGLPVITTDAQVACITFDREGRVTSAEATGAGLIRTGAETLFEGKPFARGKVELISEKNSRVVLKVKWQNKETVQPGSMLTIKPLKGQASTWEVLKCTGSAVELADVKAAISSTMLEPISGQPGWYGLKVAVSRFVSTSGRSNSGYAIGKVVCDGRGEVGRIEAIAEDGKSIKIDFGGKPAPDRAFDARIMEIGMGDTFEVANTVFLTR